MSEVQIEKSEEKALIMPIDSLYTDFKDHLDLENNKRIFFSGKFGIGKTYYLNSFFNEYKDEYDVYHLFPVNYQTRSNGDIIDLLKLDLIAGLINRNVEFDKDGNIEIIGSFLRRNSNQILQDSIDLVFGAYELLGLSVLKGQEKILKGLLSIDKRYQEYKEKYNGENNKIKNFISSVEVGELDMVSSIIGKKIKEAKSGKKSILIIDDLDRLDPEHIFRLLNIFSNCFDGGNKFGFDKIVLVGDINNIKNIFYHKYGNETDFEGYFNKFVNLKPYDFNIMNEKVVNDFIDKLVLSTSSNKDSEIKGCLGLAGYTGIILRTILGDLYRLKTKGKINLRQLLKLNNYGEFICTKVEKKRGNRQLYDKPMKYINYGIDILIYITGSKENLVDCLSQIKNFEIEPYRSNSDYLAISSFLWENNSSRALKTTDSGDIIINNSVIAELDENRQIKSFKYNDLSDIITSKNGFYILLIKYLNEKYTDTQVFF